MRISDWSSDVCSSDLYRSGNRSDDVQGLYNIISRMYQIGFKLPAANRGSGFAPRNQLALPLMVADQGLHPIDGAQSQIGTESCRESGWKYVEIPGADVCCTKISSTNSIEFRPTYTPP